MQRSESIKELATALCKAQSKLDKAKKSSVNPHFRSKFANLESVIDASREALTENGLSVTQMVGTLDGKHNLTTILMHNSGEYLLTTVELPIVKPGPQEIGSNVSYMKRYCLAAIIGLADSDDDAEAAESRPSTNQPVKPKEAVKNHAPKSNDVADYTMPFGQQKGTPIKDIPEDQLRKAIDWAVSKGKFDTFVLKSKQYLDGISLNKSDLVPNFNPDDSLPF